MISFSLIIACDHKTLSMFWELDIYIVIENIAKLCKYFSVFNLMKNIYGKLNTLSDNTIFLLINSLFFCKSSEKFRMKIKFIGNKLKKEFEAFLKAAVVLAVFSGLIWAKEENLLGVNFASSYLETSKTEGLNQDKRLKTSQEIQNFFLPFLQKRNKSNFKND